MTYSRRDALLALLALGAAAPAFAQSVGAIRRIGFLDLHSRPPQSDPHLEAFAHGLRDLGYVQGRNLKIEWRFADENVGELLRAAGELARMNLEVLVARGTPAALALKGATASTPIVGADIGDPLGQGLVSSLARPGGNVTGIANVTADIGAKQLELLKSAIPSLSRVAVLINPGNSSYRPILRGIQETAARIAVKAEPLAARTMAEMDQGFSKISSEQSQAVIVAADTVFVARRVEIAGRALKERIPLMFPYREAVTAGALMSYGPSLTEIFRRSAAYVDRILKGARPGGMPIEQPSQLELAINLQTAKTLGLGIPQELLTRADLVVE